MFKKGALLASLLSLVLNLHAQEPAAPGEVVRSIYNHALRHQQAYRWLKVLTDIGPRLAGSPQADEAVMRFRDICDSLGFQTQLQTVKVPHWLRGPQEEAAYFLEGKKQPMRICALGGSVATPKEGLQLQVKEITDFNQLEGLDLSGKIAFFNIPMEPTYIRTGFAYSEAVKQRWIGAVEASKRGAEGVLIRSLSSSVNPYPHTGSMTYQGAPRKIPAAALSTLDAQVLSRALKKNPMLKVYFKQSCQWLDSTFSYNLVADLPGAEIPHEYILIGGHLDSWDLGTGAHDDGAGSMHALGALHLLQALSIETKRSLRLVLFMNEEFGLDGAYTYAREAEKAGIEHVIAIESDGGAFTPRGITMVAPDSMVAAIKELRTYLEPYGIHRFSTGSSGADISKIKGDRVIKIGLQPDSQRYFEVHHSALDQLDAVNARELELGTAGLASLIYLMDLYDLILPAGSAQK